MGVIYGIGTAPSRTSKSDLLVLFSRARQSSRRCGRRAIKSSSRLRLRRQANWLLLLLGRSLLVRRRGNCEKLGLCNFLQFDWDYLNWPTLWLSARRIVCCRSWCLMYCSHLGTNMLPTDRADMRSCIRHCTWNQFDKLILNLESESYDVRDKVCR